MSNEKLQESMRVHKPHSVKLCNGEDSRIVNVVKPGTRQAAHRTMTVIAKLPWTSAELFGAVDGKGPTLDIVTNDGPAGELEHFGKSPKWEPLELMLKAQREVLQHRDSETKAAMVAMTNVVKECGNAVVTMSQVFRETIGASQELAELRAEAAALQAGAAVDGEAKKPEEGMVSSPVVQMLIARALPKLLDKLGSMLTEGDGPPAGDGK